MDYSVVIPLYNESPNLESLHQKLRKVMDSLGGDYEIIFVDDGSTDESLNILKSIASENQRVRIISFTKNYGQHPATIAGFEETEGELVITLDADLQNPPEEIPRLLSHMDSCGADMVAGRRMFRKDNLLRKSSSFLVNLFFSILTGVYLKDHGTMLRVLKKDLAKEIARRYRVDRLYFSVVVSKITGNISEIDISHLPRFAGRSKYSYLKLLRLVIDVILRYSPPVRRAMAALRIIRDEPCLFTVKEKVPRGQV